MKIGISSTQDVQIKTCYKQSVYKQSGLAEPAELSNRAGLGSVVQATLIKQSRAGILVSGVKKQFHASSVLRIIGALCAT